jgi:FkbM family methyltransferase
MVAREVLEPHNYLAMLRMARCLVRPADGLRRYLFGRGAYPYACGVRTPAGVVSPILYSHHDMWTLSEVFCREDYAVGADAQAVVDVGSNIGISALYFLTRNPTLRVWLYEPVPRNVDRLRWNLAAFAGRWEVHEVAVAKGSGKVSFGIEESGRYGGIGVPTEHSIEVDCLGVNDVLEHVLATVPVVDVLKVDTEGTELDIVRAIRPELLRRIRALYLEVERLPALELEGFDASLRNQTLALCNSQLSA